MNVPGVKPKAAPVTVVRAAVDLSGPAGPVYLKLVGEAIQAASGDCPASAIVIGTNDWVDGWVIVTN